MNFFKKFKAFSMFEKILWIFSMVTLTLSFVFSSSHDWLKLIATLIGATSLIFISKGDVLGQVLTVIFSILYAVISFEYRYYGEMITYLGMTMPIAVLSVIAWIKHPYEKNKAEVAVNHLSLSHKIWMFVLSFIVTIIFYFILKYFDTPNLIESSISVTTSFIAEYLMLFRSSAYAIGDASNDIILIILWFKATIKDISYLPMEVCFIVFLINDIYGFYNWRKIKRRQLKKQS